MENSRIAESELFSKEELEVFHHMLIKERDKLVPKRGTLSIQKAKQLLGYNPTYPIEVGYQEYINWYKNFSDKI